MDAISTLWFHWFSWANILMQIYKSYIHYIILYYYVHNLFLLTSSFYYHIFLIRRAQWQPATTEADWWLRPARWNSARILQYLIIWASSTPDKQAEYGEVRLQAPNTGVGVGVLLHQIGVVLNVLIFDFEYRILCWEIGTWESREENTRDSHDRGLNSISGMTGIASWMQGSLSLLQILL